MISQYSQKKEVSLKLYIKGFSEAFVLGGIELERTERANYKKE